MTVEDSIDDGDPRVSLVVSACYNLCVPSSISSKSVAGCWWSAGLLGPEVSRV